MAWSDIARVCRRVCVLRERGQIEEAERLRAGELMEKVAIARSPAETDTAVTERLNAIFAAETERVANASVLAELLAPLLTGQVFSPEAARAIETTTKPAPIAAPVASSGVVEKPAPPRAGSIADFIDEMIAQEKPPVRSTEAGQRRAS